MTVRRSLTFFGLCWTGFVLIFDVLVCYGVINQIRAEYFSRTTGEITQSEVTTYSNRRGHTYGVDIRYRYQVGGATYEGDRFRYGGGSWSVSAWAYEAVARHPVKSQTIVFYNPRNPSESVLIQGLDGFNFMLLVLVTPFNMAMIGFWAAGISLVHSKLFKSPNGGVKVIQHERQIRIRLPRIPSLPVFLAVTGLAAFIETPLLVIMGGFSPKSPLPQLALAFAYSAGLAAFLWRCWKINSGATDMKIDQSDGTVELPKGFGRKTRKQIVRSQIKGVCVKKTTKQYSKGGLRYTYAPILKIAGEAEDAGKLAEWSNQEKAEDFAEWLRPQLQLEPEHRPNQSLSAPAP